jgi:uracil-DNA glycosylase
MDAKETSDELFRLLGEAVGECPESAKRAKDGVSPAFPGITPVVRQIPGLGFFPGGDGLWKDIGHSEPADRNPKSVMVVGNTFGCMKYFDDLVKKRPLAEENCRTGTWRQLLSILEEYKSRCFFTNAYPGLLNGDENIDNDLRPADFDSVFLSQCREFFFKQVELTMPKVILFLGKFSPFVLGGDRFRELGWLPFVNCKRGCIRKFKPIDEEHKSFIVGSRWTGVSNDVGIAILLHPCNRHRNFDKRGLEYPGRDKEIPFLQHIMRITHPDGYSVDASRLG